MGIADQGDSSHTFARVGSASAKPARMSRKRKAPDITSNATFDGKEIIDLTTDTPPKKQKKESPVKEKRWKIFRGAPSQRFQEIRDRALSQRMFVIDRERDTSDPERPKERVSLAGTTGNVYSVVIDRVPQCNCPHALKGNLCKHIVYVLVRVLRVPSNLEYQHAFLSTELEEIFARAPPLPSEQAKSSEKDGNRKSIDGECPVCCVDFEPDKTDEEIVYCETGCGNNIHKECFKRWAATKKDGQVTCPFCRTPWQDGEESLKDAARGGQVNEDGYVNIASQLGLSGQRDYSTYHRPWVRRQFGYDY